MACVSTQLSGIAHREETPLGGVSIVRNIHIKQEPYKRELVETNSARQKTLKMKQIEKRISALGLSKEELEKMFLKSSLSIV